MLRSRAQGRARDPPRRRSNRDGSGAGYVCQCVGVGMLRIREMILQMMRETQRLILEEGAGGGGFYRRDVLLCLLRCEELKGARLFS